MSNITIIIKAILILYLLHLLYSCNVNYYVEDGGRDIFADNEYVKPSLVICPQIPKCYNNTYPPFIGYDTNSCISTIDRFSASEVQQLLDANGDCDKYRSILLDYIIQELCSVFKRCLPSDVYKKNLGGSIEACENTLKLGEPDYDLTNCIYEASMNNDCNKVILCINSSQSDGGYDIIIDDTGYEKVCISDTGVYNCEEMCEKYHDCTNRYCPPWAGECTREDCINSCKDPYGNLTVELMCCIIDSSCEEMERLCF